MLTGKDLGDAIREAIRLKKASGAISGTSDVAGHFGIKTPSIYDWMKKGSIGFVGPMLQCMAMEPEIDAPLALSIPAGYVPAIVDKQEGQRLPVGFVQ